MHKLPGPAPGSDFHLHHTPKRPSQPEQQPTDFSSNYLLFTRTILELRRQNPIVGNTGFMKNLTNTDYFPAIK